MNNFLYNFWIQTKPLRSKWIVPLVALTFILIIFYYFGGTDDMRCNWEERDRWECYPNIINES